MKDTQDNGNPSYVLFVKAFRYPTFFPSPNCLSQKKKKIITTTEMGHRKVKKKPNRRGGQKRPEKTRKVTGAGKIKRKRGDLKMVHSANTGFKVRQKKGGKWVKTGGERVCKIHTKCNCVAKTDPAKQRFIHNR